MEGTQGYTVKQVAALTGILETTLRMWERRYGVVEPRRSPGGYRLYDDADVARLRTMASLVADGVPASIAARSVNAPAHPTPEGDAADLATLDLVEAAASLDPVRLDGVLTSALQGPPIDRAIDGWLMPELTRLGEAWAVKDLTVAHEHFATAGVMRALGRVFDDAPDASPERPVLVGLPPGSQHELGLFAFATSLRRRGVSVVYLGADVPVADWEKAAATLRPRAAVVGVPQCTRVAKAQEVVDRLHGVTPPVAVWVGGALAPRVRRAEALPDTIAQAADEALTALRSGRT